MPKPVRIETLGDNLTHDHVWANCREFYRNAELNLPALIEKYGTAFPLVATKSKLKCTNCGKRNVSKFLAPLAEQVRPS
jgi:hypothetical protein